MGKNCVEPKQWLDKHCGDFLSGKSSIINSAENAECSGCPNSAVVPNLIKAHRITLQK